MDRYVSFDNINKAFKVISVSDIISVLFFCSILLIWVSTNVFFNYFSAMVFVLAFCWTIICKRKIVRIVIIVETVIVIFAAINYIFVGNTNKSLYTMVFGLFLALVFLDKNTSSNAFLVAFVVNVAYICLMFIKNGVKENVYVNISNNYISVILLSILVLYYMKCEIEKKDIRFLPAIIGLIISFFAGGRGGVLAFSLFFILLLIISMFNGKKSKKIAIILLLATVVLLFIVLNNKESLTDYRVVNRAITKGMLNDIRTQVWFSYFENIDNFESFFLGKNLDSIEIVNRLNGNVHNSFLNIHAHYGGIVFVGMILLSINCVKIAIKNRRWIFLAAFIAFCVRAMTDTFLGCNRFTPVFWCFLMYPFILSFGEKENSDMMLNC